MSFETRTLVEVTQEAIQILYRELGVVDTVRFLRQFTLGFGNYTEEREQLFADMTLADIVADMQRQPRESGPQDK
jgi:hypothetical protein